jgi:putative addiction module component (TIGR02574 family)
MSQPAMPPPGFDDLSPEEKIAYVEALWNRIAEREEDVPVPDWHREILAQRLKELRDGDPGAKPWSEVKAELQRKLRDVRR